MAVLKKSLRELATAPLSGFRTKVITVSEWEGATVVLREPSPAGWARWRDVMKPGEGDGETETPALSLSEEAQRNIRADVVMLIDVLLDEDRQPVFTQADAEPLLSFMGRYIPDCCDRRWIYKPQRQTLKKSPRARNPILNDACPASGSHLGRTT